MSGAIQHLVGCKGAKRILAIIGDLHAVLPALVAEIRKARGA